MATTAIILTKDWQLIAGSNMEGTIQVLSGIAYLCDSDDTPDAEQAAHPRGVGDVTFSGVNVYGRSGNTPAVLIVTANAKG